MPRPQFEPPLPGLARGDTAIQRLHPVIDGIPDEVDQRILDGLDDAAVELRLAAVHVDRDLLPARGAEVAHKTRKAVEQGVEGLQTGPRDVVLELVRDAIQELRCTRQLSRRTPAGELHDPVAHENQLTDEVHQPVQQAHIDPDGALRDRCRLDGLPDVAGAGQLGRRCGLGRRPLRF